jgi:hypothetical protein
VDSLRTLHARVAALSRHRHPGDPDIAAARAELERCKEANHALRVRISSLSPTVCAQLLPQPERAPTSV